MKSYMLCVATLLSLGLPALAAAQGTGGLFSLQGAVGANANVGGHTQSLSLGVSPGEHVTVLLNAERIHMPTEINEYPGGFSATRGGTTTFVSGEVQVNARFGRVAPYVLAGAGAGRSRLNVNDRFPDPVTNTATLLFVGGGIRVPATAHLSVFADTRFTLQVEHEHDGLFLFVPVRAGLAWRF